MCFAWGMRRHRLTFDLEQRHYDSNKSVTHTFSLQPLRKAEASEFPAFEELCRYFGEDEVLYGCCGSCARIRSVWSLVKNDARSEDADAAATASSSWRTSAHAQGISRHVTIALWRPLEYPTARWQGSMSSCRIEAWEARRSAHILSIGLRTLRT